MFANAEAIRTLVKADPTASSSEKSAALAALSGLQPPTDPTAPLVVDFDEAARLLGFKAKTRLRRRVGVSDAIRKGIIAGWYPGKGRRRAQGVVYSSILEAVKSSAAE